MVKGVHHFNVFPQKKKQQDFVKMEILEDFYS